MRICSLLLPVLFASLIARAQFNEMVALNVGDKCPDVTFANLLRYKDSEAKLSDFRGKRLIIDFWATWCTPCLKSFPKLEKLQQSLKNNLQIMLVTAENQKSIENFYNMKPKLSLVTSVTTREDVIFTLFPHQQIPHAIWLDENGIVRAITGSNEMTVENITTFANGGEVAFVHKTFSARAKPVMQIVNEAVQRSLANPDTTTLFTSTLTRHMPDSLRYNRYRYVGPQFKHRVIDRTFNYPISHLYSVAFGMYDAKGFENYSIYDRVIVESKDSLKIQYPSYYSDLPPGALQAWKQENTYCYTLVLPPGQTDSLSRFKVMQRDLVRYFGYECRIAQRNVKCLILKATGPNVSKTKGDTTMAKITTYGVVLKNQPIDHLLSGLQKYVNGIPLGTTRYLPVVDETGWKENIDISFTVEDISNLELLRKELARFNLDCVVEVRSIQAVVISDPN